LTKKKADMLAITVIKTNKTTLTIGVIDFIIFLFYTILNTFFSQEKLNKTMNNINNYD
jgi:hypothetical protein